MFQTKGERMNSASPEQQPVLKEIELHRSIASLTMKGIFASFVTIKSIGPNKPEAQQELCKDLPFALPN
jgi:hypothetical protein